VCYGLAHRTVWCTISVRRWTSHSRENWAVLRYNSPDCPVCQQSNSYLLQRSTAKAADRGTVKISARRVRATESEAHRTVLCHKKTKLQWSTELRTLMVGWHGSAPDSEQDLSGGAPDCPVRPSPAASPTTSLVVESYKYPQPPQLQASKISEYHIQYKSSSIHS
jgi:hypothetical protein